MALSPAALGQGSPPCCAGLVTVYVTPFVPAPQGAEHALISVHVPSQLTASTSMVCFFLESLVSDPLVAMVSIPMLCNEAEMLCYRAEFGLRQTTSAELQIRPLLATAMVVKLRGDCRFPFALHTWYAGGQVAADCPGSAIMCGALSAELGRVSQDLVHGRPHGVLAARHGAIRICPAANAVRGGNAGRGCARAQCRGAC